jgi:hypothetical protein
MAYLGPWTLVAAVAAVAAALSRLRPDRNLAGPSAFLAALALPSIVVFTAVPLWGGDALPHWQMPGWLFLLPILGHAIAGIEARRGEASRLAHGFARAATAVLVLAIAAVMMFRALPPSPATIARLRIGGFLEESVTWRGLAAGLSERGLLAAVSPTAAPQGRPLVVAFRWIEAARLAEALGPRATIAVFDSDPRGFAFLADPAAWLGRDVLLIGRPKTFARGLEAVRPLFSRIDRQAPIAVKVGDTTLFEAQVAIGRSLTSPYPLPYPPMAKAPARWTSASLVAGRLVKRTSVESFRLSLAQTPVKSRGPHCAACLAPLSVHSGGSPILFPSLPTMPGERP